MHRVFAIGCAFGLLLCLLSPIVSDEQGARDPYQCYPGDENSMQNNQTTTDIQPSGNYEPTTYADDGQGDYSEYDPESEAWSDPSSDGG